MSLQLLIDFVKRYHYVIAVFGVLILTSCSQDQPEGKKPHTAAPAAARPAAEMPRQNSEARSLGPLSRLGTQPGLGSEHEILRLIKERGGKGEDPANLLNHRLGLLKERKPLSDEELRKNREFAAKRREEQLAEARKNIDSKDDALRLKAVSHLDTSDANDLALLENALMSDASSEIREEAAIQLSDGDPKVNVPALLNALNDPEPDVAVAAIESLSAIEGGDRSAIEAAIKNIGSSHQNEDVKEAAQTALETMR
ncbi:MAG: HEAT repeat domain-containing protein [Gammaproteobacteria bacterium]